MAAIGHRRAGRLDQAAAGFKCILEADPDNFVALNQLASVMRKVGDNDSADDLIARAVAVAVEAHRILGQEDSGEAALGDEGQRAGLAYGTELAADYARFRNASKEVLEALLQGGGVESHSRVLEVGCGTGDYIIRIEKETGCPCWGIDTSEPMLAHARARSDSVRFTAGSAARLKFPDGAFDLVFTVNVIHYIDRPQDYFSEAYRVLARGGRVCAFTAPINSKVKRRNPDLLTRYFGGLDGVNRPRIPTIEDLAACIRGAGFRHLSHEERERRSVTTNIFHAVGMIWTIPGLRTMPHDEFAHGLARLEHDLSKGPITVERSSLFAWATK